MCFHTSYCSQYDTSRLLVFSRNTNKTGAPVSIGVNQSLNKQVQLAERPDGKPELDDFKIVESPRPTPQNNEVLVRTKYISVDPYIRLRMRDSLSVGEVMPAGAVGEVVESNASGFETGDIVTGSGYLQELEWAEYTVATPEKLRHVETGTAPISTALGVLGMPGRTAYFGVLDVGTPKPGDTVVVSGAAGAVGSIAGQIASMAGGRVVGTAGSDEKVAWITDELGFEAGINYRSVDDIDEAIALTCAKGVDVYFDNVGGSISDAVFRNLNTNARVAVCGQISHYNGTGASVGPRVLPAIQGKQARIENFSVGNFSHRYDEANERLIEWVTSGKLSYRESMTEGLDNAPAAFVGLFDGENIGKQLVKVG